MSGDAKKNNDLLDRGLETAPAATQAGEPGDEIGAKTWSVIRALREQVESRPSLPLAVGDEAPIDPKPTQNAAASPKRIGHYEVHDRIAQGGMGVVLKGRDTDLGREVALKFLKAEHRGSKTMVQRFVDEAQIGGQLQHPGILPVYELGLDAAGAPFFSMKLIHGRTLQEVIAGTDLSKDRARLLSLMQQICQAMAYAHARGVIHRDLKPSNVMIGQFGEVQIVDWGLAKVLTSNSAEEQDGGASNGTPPHGNEPAASHEKSVTTARHGSNVELSAAGSVLGTLLYMAPEQARGELHRLNRQTDVFALGAILCEILTGRPLYDGDRLAVFDSAIEGSTEPAIRRLGQADVDDELQSIVKRCIAAEPAARYRDAGLLANALGDYLDSVSERARRAELSAARAEARANAERRALRLTIALAGLVIATILSGAAIYWRMEKNRRDLLDQASQSINSEISRAAQRLGRALVAEHGDREPWNQLEIAGESLRAALGNTEVHLETGRRAHELLEQITQARRKRSFLDQIEQITMNRLPDGGSSWKLMERDMRQAFADYGINLEQNTPQEIQATIRHSEMSVELTHALDLWIRARFVVSRDPKIFSEWLPVLYAADPDPWRVRIRQLTFADKVTVEQVRDIEESIVPADADALTYHYLLSAYSRVPNSDGWLPAMKRAHLLFPDDCMLHFTHGTTMMQMRKFPEAIQSLRIAASLRPNAAGVWRALGRAWLWSGDAPEAIHVLEKSLAIESSAVTLVEYANALEASNRIDEARQRFIEAMSLGDEHWIGFRDYGSFLTRRGEFNEAARWLTKYVAARKHIEQELKTSRFATNIEKIGAVLERKAAERLLQKSLSQITIPESYRPKPATAPEE